MMSQADKTFLYVSRNKTIFEKQVKLVEVSPNWTDNYQRENPSKEETG